MTAIALKAIQDGIRLPHSLVVAYPPYRLQFLPSPSRILCLMDPLLPVGVLKSCIQAYTGGFFKKTEGKSFTYDASSYNAFDLDFGSGGDSCARGSLDKNTLQHSYSETQLNVIKAKYNQHMDNSFPEESESFCSEFPCSDTEPENITDSTVDNEDYLYFKAHSSGTSEKEGDSSTDDTSSLLQSLTNQVSSKMLNITTSLSGYFSAATENFTYSEYTPATKTTNDTKTGHQRNISNKQGDIQQPHEKQQHILSLELDSESTDLEPTLGAITQLQDNENPTIRNKQQQEQQSEHNQELKRKRPLDLEISTTNNTYQDNNHLTILTDQSERLSINEEDADNILPRKEFYICRQCLYREEQCICHLSPKQLRRRSEHANHHHYRFSHHHLNNNHYQNPRKTHLSAKQGRSNSLTSIDNKDLSLNNDTRRNTSVSGGDCTNRTRSVTECEETDGSRDIENLSTGQRDLQLGTSNALCSPTSKDKQLQNFRLSLLGNSSVEQSPPSSPSGTKDRAAGNYSPRVLYDRTTESCVILTPDDEEGELKTFDDGQEKSSAEKSTKQKLGVDSKAFNDAKDPLMSPFLADDEILMSLPPITIVVSFICLCFVYVVYRFIFFLVLVRECLCKKVWP